MADPIRASRRRGKNVLDFSFYRKPKWEKSHFQWANFWGAGHGRILGYAVKQVAQSGNRKTV